MGESDSEAELVDSAYADEVKLLFKTLVGELTGRGGVPGPNEEQQCLQRFKAGLALARRARELALSAIAPAAAPRASARIPPRQGRARALDRNLAARALGRDQFFREIFCLSACRRK